MTKKTAGKPTKATTAIRALRSRSRDTSAAAIKGGGLIYIQKIRPKITSVPSPD